MNSAPAGMARGPGRDLGPTLTCAAGSYPTATLVAAILRTAGQLRACGVRPGDRVLLRGENSPGYVVALLALAHLDTSLTLIDHGLPRADTQAALTRAGVRWVVQDPAGALPLTGVTALPFPDLAALAPAAPEPATLRPTESGPAARPPAAPVPPAVAAAGAGPVSLAGWRQRDDAVILWSSGTTGPPKAVVKSGRAVLDNTASTQQVMGYRPDDVLSPWLPFSHQYGLSMVLLWWLAGATLLVTPYRMLTRAVSDTIRHRATVVDAPPSTYYTLLRLVERRPELAGSLAAVRCWGVGGAPLPTPLATAFRTAIGQPLLDGYGLSEVGNVALATPARPIGCGPPLPGVRVRVVGRAGDPVRAGEQGEIEVCSGGLMTGYLTTAGLTAPDPWFRTNDLGYLDRAGNLHVLGRRQAVHRHGHTLYPESIERRAEQVCGRAVTVLAVPDQRRGASLVFVVSDPAGEPPRRWRQRLCAALPEHEHPNQVVVLDTVPVTATGKTDRTRLRAQLLGAG